MITVTITAGSETAGMQISDELETLLTEEYDRMYPPAEGEEAMHVVEHLRDYLLGMVYGLGKDMAAAKYRNDPNTLPDGVTPTD